MIRRHITMLVLGGTMGAFSALPITAQAVSVEAIESADTPAAHEALAAEYEKEAATAREEAAKHRKMADAYASSVSYGKVKHGGRSAMKQHCERLAEHYEASAKEADALAKMHRDLVAEQ